MPGHYSFPFSFMLPQDIPGSVFVKVPRGQASIAYNFSAILESNQKKLSPIAFQVKAIMREHLMKDGLAKAAQLNQDITTWCCISRGSTQIKAQFSKDAFMPGEVARVQVEADNSQCKNSISAVRCSLIQTTTLTSTTKTRSFPSTIVTGTSTGIDAGGKFEGEEARSIDLRLPAGQEGEISPQKMNMNDGHEGDDDDDVNGSETTDTIAPSTNGQIVKVRFDLHADLVVSGCLCCEQHPGVSAQVQIYSPFVQPTFMFQVPDNWNLQQMPTNNLAFDQQYAMSPPPMNPNMGNGGGMVQSQMMPQSGDYPQYTNQVSPYGNPNIEMQSYNQGSPQGYSQGYQQAQQQSPQPNYQQNYNQPQQNYNQPQQNYNQPQQNYNQPQQGYENDNYNQPQ